MPRRNPVRENQLYHLRAIHQRLHPRHPKQHADQVSQEIPRGGRVVDRRHPVSRRQGTHAGGILPYVQHPLRRHKQIVLSSDRAPKRLVTLEDRLRSRFELVATTSSRPSWQTRIAILRRKAIQDTLNVPPEVLEYIASRISTNIRELEGALIRVSQRVRQPEPPVRRPPAGRDRAQGPHPRGPRAPQITAATSWATPSTSGRRSVTRAGIFLVAGAGHGLQDIAHVPVPRAHRPVAAQDRPAVRRPRPHHRHQRGQENPLPDGRAPVDLHAGHRTNQPHQEQQARTGQPVDASLCAQFVDNIVEDIRKKPGDNQWQVRARPASATGRAVPFPWPGTSPVAKRSADLREQGFCTHCTYDDYDSRRQEKNKHQVGRVHSDTSRLYPVTRTLTLCFPRSRPCSSPPTHPALPREPTEGGSSREAPGLKVPSSGWSVPWSIRACPAGPALDRLCAGPARRLYAGTELTLSTFDYEVSAQATVPGDHLRRGRGPRLGAVCWPRSSGRCPPAG